VPSSTNTAWNLERFLDALVVELDRAQDTLAMKGITRKLTYSVKDLNLDLQIFPRFDGKGVQFVTASPGQEGSSKLTIQLGSITDRQIRENTRAPTAGDDLDLDEVDGLDDDLRDDLRQIGVHSADDFDRLRKNRVNVEGALKKKRSRSQGKKKGGTDYGKLADLIKRAKRQRNVPRVLSVSVDGRAGGTELSLEGENLVMSTSHSGFPIAALNDRQVDVVSGGPNSLRLSVQPGDLSAGSPNNLRVALDPYTLIKLEIEA